MKKVFTAQWKVKVCDAILSMFTLNPLTPRVSDTTGSRLHLRQSRFSPSQAAVLGSAGPHRRVTPVLVRPPQLSPTHTQTDRASCPAWNGGQPKQLSGWWTHPGSQRGPDVFFLPQELADGKSWRKRQWILDFTKQVVRRRALAECPCRSLSHAWRLFCEHIIPVMNRWGAEARSRDVALDSAFVPL